MPLQSLPIELLTHILTTVEPLTLSRFKSQDNVSHRSHLVRRARLLLLSYVSLVWRDVARELLWDRIEVNSEVELDRLLAADGLGVFTTRHLTLVVPFNPRITERGISEEDAAVYQRMQEKMWDVVRRLKGLQELVLGKGPQLDSRFMELTSLSGLRKLTLTQPFALPSPTSASGIPSFNALKSLDITLTHQAYSPWDPNTVANWDIEVLSAIFAASRQTLTSLTIGLQRSVTKAGVSHNQDTLLATLPLLSQSPITHIILPNTPGLLLHEVLTTFVHLQHLTLPSNDLSLFFDAFKPHRIDHDAPLPLEQRRRSNLSTLDVMPLLPSQWVGIPPPVDSIWEILVGRVDELQEIGAKELRVWHQMRCMIDGRDGFKLLRVACEEVGLKVQSVRPMEDAVTPGED